MIYNIKTTGTGIKICICDKTDCNKGSPFFVGLQPDLTSPERQVTTGLLVQILQFGNGRVSGGNFRKTYCSGSTALPRRSAEALTVEVLKQKSQKPTPGTPFAELEPANVGIYTLLQREE